MKKVKAVFMMSVILFFVSGCSDDKGRYVNLSNGETFEPMQDEQTGVVIDKETKEPVYIYVDTQKNDTIYGRTGKVINGHVVKIDDNKYVFDEDEKLEIGDNGSIEYKDGDYKMEIEKDGDIKIKDGDKKVKIDGETGERKVKND
jgi:pyruvate kinase